MIRISQSFDGVKYTSVSAFIFAEMTHIIIIKINFFIALNKKSHLDER
jgi:hypothetical protein